MIEQAWQKDDPDPKALACYGVLWQTGPLDDPDRSQVWLRFVTGRPVSAISTQFLEYCCERLVAQGKRNWLLMWDNASWHGSKHLVADFLSFFQSGISTPQFITGYSDFMKSISVD